MNCFHLGGRAFHSRSLPLTQQGCAALNKTPAGERHTKKASLLQRSRHLHTSAFHSRTRPRPAHSSDASRAPTLTYALSHVFDSRATHARTLLPAALASVPFGFVLVRVRVRAGCDLICHDLSTREVLFISVCVYHVEAPVLVFFVWGRGFGDLAQEPCIFETAQYVVV